VPLIGLAQLRRALEGEIPSFDPIPAPAWPVAEVARNGPVLGDKETAARRQCLVDLISLKGGASPPAGRLERVERLHLTMASEVGEIRQGDEEKSGLAGTWVAQAAQGRWIAQTSNARPLRGATWAGR